MYGFRCISVLTLVLFIDKGPRKYFWVIKFRINMGVSRCIKIERFLYGEPKKREGENEKG